MIEHPHPKLTRGRMFTFEDLQHYTRNVDVGQGPSQRLLANYLGVLHGPLFRGKPNVAYSGLLFELCVYDALVAYGVDAGTIEYGIDLSVHGKHAEADLLVDRRVAIMTKTSLRERWKQCDRDAIVIGFAQDAIDCYVVFYQEKPGDMLEQAKRKAATIQRQMYSGATVLTVRDEPAVDALFRRCIEK